MLGYKYIACNVHGYQLIIFSGSVMGFGEGSQILMVKLHFESTHKRCSFNDRQYRAK